MAETNSAIPTIAAVIAAGSIGGLGGHTIGSAEETIVNATTVEHCKEFMLHARQHERSDCDIEKLKLMMECKNAD